MKHDEFSEIINSQLEKCKSLLTSKSREYAMPDDMLHNFTVAAELLGVNQRQALGGFMAKHTVSIYDMIQAPNDFALPKWEEKITDHINYLLILGAVIAEERNLKQEKGPKIFNT